MKLIQFTLSLILSVSLFSCGSEKLEETPVSNSVIITGTITNPTDGDVLITRGRENNIGLVDEAGHFIVEFELSQPGYYHLNYNKEYARVYLSPGDSLSISMDTEMFDESLKFEGRGAEANNYMIGMYLLREKIDSEHPFAEMHKLSPEIFLAYVDSMNLVCVSFLEKEAASNGLSDDFVQMEKDRMVYDRASTLSNYPETAAYFQEVDSVPVPAEFSHQPPIENNTLIGAWEYERFVNGIIHKKSKMVYDSIPEDQRTKTIYGEVKLNAVDELLNDQQLKDHFLSSTMHETIDHFGAENLNSCFELFASKCSNAQMIKDAEEAIAEWSPLWEGSIAPAFSYKDMSGNEVDLASFQGKAVYIDVWATWCGPCKREIPFLQDLEHDYHGRDIEFVSISVDSDTTAWRNMVTEKQLGGIQLVSEKAWETSIAIDYKITSIPRFILIDNAGKIVSAHAPRPSSGKEVRDLIEKTINATENDVAIDS